MGAAACYSVARRGKKVLGLEQFELAHNRGSHTGDSRLIRRAYFEHPDYVPLLTEAYRLWDAIEQEAAEKLFYRTGILYVGPETSDLLSGVLRSAKEYDVDVVLESTVCLREVARAEI